MVIHNSSKSNILYPGLGGMVVDSYKMGQTGPNGRAGSVAAGDQTMGHGNYASHVGSSMMSGDMTAKIGSTGAGQYSVIDGQMIQSIGEMTGNNAMSIIGNYSGLAGILKYQKGNKHQITVEN